MNACALEWDPNLAQNGPQGGSGNWTGGSFWWNGTTNVPWVNGSVATFGGAAGTVTADGISVEDMTFNSDYVIQGSTPDATLGLSFAGANDGIHTISASNGVFANIAIRLSGTNQMVKDGPGSVALAQVDTYSGRTTIRNGTLISNDSLSPLSPILIETNGTLSLGKSQSINFEGGAGIIALGSNSLALNSISGAPVTFSGRITGSGELSIFRPLVLSGTLSSFSGGVQIGSSVSIVALGNSGSNGPLGSAGTITLVDGTLTITSSATGLN